VRLAGRLPWVAMCMIAGCLPRQGRNLEVSGAQGAALRYLALGDSYTIGEGVAPGERWPVQLAARLAREGLEVAAPEIVARTGWTAAELEAGVDARRPIGTFALVTLMVGVNDQYRGQDTTAYRRQLARLLARATDLAGGRADRVIVMSIPDWGVTPFASGRDRAEIAAEIDRFNDAARDEAARAGSRWIDITPVSRRAAREPGLIAGDGLHPSRAMYAEWADLVAPTAIAILRVPRR